MTFHSGFNDAWETPGWTAQNMAYPPADGSQTGLPVGLFKLPLIGTFRDQNGKTLWGKVQLTPSVHEVVCGGVVITLEPFTVEFINGSLTDVSVLAPTADSNAVPSSWEWSVRQSVGRSRDTYSITVPYPDNPVDVTQIQNLDDLIGVEDLPLTRDWTVFRDADFSREYIWDQQDGTGLDTWRATLTVKDADGVVQLVLTEHDGISLGSDSTIVIYLDNTQAAGLSNGTYDLVLVDPNNSDDIRFLQGRITVT
jgi:hypothetical protein